MYWIPCVCGKAYWFDAAIVLTGEVNPPEKPEIPIGAVNPVKPPFSPPKPPMGADTPPTGAAKP